MPVFIWRMVEDYKESDLMKLWYSVTAFTVTAFLVVSACGCNAAETNWYKAFDWKAEDYFDDSKVVALCKAIEIRDIKEIDRLVADGADVKALGKDGMTPLLWAFPENKSEVFKKILEYGGDPNVIVKSDFKTKNLILPGDSVLHMAANTSFPNYFKYVMQHGGNPNLVSEKRFKDSPLISVITGRCPTPKDSVQLLIDAGADLDYVNSTERTALSYALSFGSQYDIALILLKAGASFNLCKKNGQTVIHDITFEKNNVNNFSEKKKKDFMKIVAYLKKKGADIEGAKKDNAIWADRGKLSPERIAELKKRYADELEAKKKAKEIEKQAAAEHP